ncbi:hypothetical protein ABPG74_014046 [Tetrahymena malaccensis]
MGKIKQGNKPNKDGETNKSLFHSLLKNERLVIEKKELNSLSLMQLTQLIEEISQEIIAKPEVNIIHMQTLFHLLERDSILIVKLSAYSIVEIFKDITPLYQINFKESQEKLATKITKEERQVIQTECRIYEFYEKYIKLMAYFAKLKNKEAKNLGQEVSEETKQQFNQLRRIGTKCLLELLKHLYHFNFAKEIAEFVTHKLVSVDKKVRDSAIEIITSILQDPTHSIYEIKVVILNEMGKILNTTTEKDLPDDFIEIVGCVEIDTKFLKKDFDEDKRKKAIEYKKAKRQFYKDKEKEKGNVKNSKKRKLENAKGEKDDIDQVKSMKGVDKNELKKMKKELREELEEQDAEIDPKLLIKYNAQILEKVYYIYFKLIKRPSPTKFFTSVMDGIVKFIHMIDVNLIWDLIGCLQKSAQNMRQYTNKKGGEDKLALHKRMHCIYTVEAILNGPGQVFDVDDKEAILNFFHVMIDLNKIPHVFEQLSQKEELVLIKILEIMFLKKRQFSYESVASFVKELAKLVIKLNDKKQFQYTVLFVIKMLFAKHSKIHRMLDSDNDGFGLNRYNERIEDPQSTNAINTSIHEELTKVQATQSNPEIKNICKKILESAPLHPSLSTLSVQDFYNKHSNLK